MLPREGRRLHLRGAGYLRRRSHHQCLVRSAQAGSEPVIHPRGRSEANRGCSVRVLILGCGPSGLIAAHAAYNRGADFIVVSKARKSFMNGAQYLHAPIPGVSIKEPFLINYETVSYTHLTLPTSDL